MKYDIRNMFMSDDTVMPR